MGSSAFVGSKNICKFFMMVAQERKVATAVFLSAKVVRDLHIYLILNTPFLPQS